MLCFQNAELTTSQLTEASKRAEWTEKTNTALKKAKVMDHLSQFSKPICTVRFLQTISSFSLPCFSKYKSARFSKRDQNSILLSVKVLNLLKFWPFKHVTSCFQFHKNTVNQIIPTYQTHQFWSHCSFLFTEYVEINKGCLKSCLLQLQMWGNGLTLLCLLHSTCFPIQHK